MSDEWNDEPAGATSSYNDEGRSFGKGRGFVPRNESNGVSYGGSNGQGDDEWDDRGERSSGGRGGGRGRGGSRGRGGGNRFGNDNGHNGDDDGDTRRGRGGGCGGGRGGRGGFQSRDRNGDNGGDDFGAGGDNGEDRGDKPEPVTYVPPEPSNDDSVLFGNGVDVGINFDKYDDIVINVSGENVPKLIQSFEEAGLRPFVLENIKKSGYTKPTPVQKHALPIVLAGRDLMACAQTGSGKTAAFMVPIVNSLLSDPTELVVSSTHCEPQAVIVAPTRELATQIFDQARKFAKDSTLKCVNIYGGTAVYHQRQQVLRGAHILVATVGRLKDFVEHQHVSFASVRFFVLDEADRMLDFGFLPEIERLLDDATMVRTGERQTLMFSATFPAEVQTLAAKFLKDYIFLAVGIVGGACQDVVQTFHEVSKFQKRKTLDEILKDESENGEIQRTLIFVETKRTADFLAAFLSESNYSTTSIHGDRLQRERETALSDFRTGRRPLLVATAVAARGLDIKGVAHVINYDLPKSIDEYVHRIGRTGRVGNSGKATSFYDPENDSALLPDLLKTLKQANQEIPGWLGSGGSGLGGGASRGSRFGGHDVRSFDNDANGESYPDTAYSAATEPEEEW